MNFVRSGFSREAKCSEAWYHKVWYHQIKMIKPILLKMKQNFDFKLGLTLTLIKWSIDYWYPFLSHKNDSFYDARKFLNILKLWFQSNGPKYTIKRVKTLRLIVTRYLSGSPLVVLPGSDIAVDKTGFPKCIIHLRKYADSDNFDDKRFLLTLLCVSRTFKVKGTLDLASITDPFKGKVETLDNDKLLKIISDFNLFITDEKGLPGINREKITLMNFFSITTKAGPAGHAFSTSIWVMSRLNNRMKACIMALVGPKIVQFLSDSYNFLPKKLQDEFGKIKYETLRRLSVINDPEMKCRVVAMSDYWTQIALKPLHKELFRLLRTRFSQDRTFTQDPYLHKIEGERFHSLDLTAATDRIPAILQRDILQLITDKNTAWAWYHLMVSEEFLIPGSKTEFVKYSVGQPMGALSSWAMMALTHHIIVQYSALLVGKYPFKDYILLGDDIVINNDMVASSYREVMTDLGVDLSEYKTHVSKDTYEFAKRWFHKGTEVTGLPLGGFMDNFHNPILMVSQILDQIRKGNGPRLLGVRAPQLLKYLYSYDSLYEFRPPKRKWVVSAIHRSENFYTLQRLTHHFNYDEARSWLVKFLPGDVMVHPGEENLQKYYEGLFQHAILSTLQEVKISLMQMVIKFERQILDLWPEFINVPNEQKYFYYGKMHIFYAALKSLYEQNKDGILLTDIHDVNKQLESIIVPNMETSFTSRKSVIMTVAFDTLTKRVIKVTATGFADSTRMLQGQAQALGSAWVTAIDDFSSLLLSPSELEIRRMNSQMWF